MSEFVFQLSGKSFVKNPRCIGRKNRGGKTGKGDGGSKALKFAGVFDPADGAFHSFGIAFGFSFGFGKNCEVTSR